MADNTNASSYLSQENVQFPFVRDTEVLVSDSIKNEYNVDTLKEYLQKGVKPNFATLKSMLDGTQGISATESNGKILFGHSNTVTPLSTVDGTPVVIPDGGSFEVINHTYDANGHITGFVKKKFTLTKFPTSLPASDVYPWAKAETKPVYTASEVGADSAGSANAAYQSSKAYTDSKILDIMGGTDVGTLSDLADRVQTNEEDIDDIYDKLDTKVDKIAGKGLSTNDFNNAYKAKLDGIEDGAQVNTIVGVKGDNETTYQINLVNIKDVDTARKFYTARKLMVDLANNSTDTSFDGSDNQLGIRVTGVAAVVNGGTGKNTHTLNSVIVGNNAGAVKNIGSVSGALYSTGSGVEPKFGTLPVAQGGTGKTSLTANSILYGNGTNNVVELVPAKGVVYYETASSEPSIVENLPVSHGGTGSSNLTEKGLIISHGNNPYTATSGSTKGVVYYKNTTDGPDVVSELPVTHGGTGKDTLTARGLLVGNGTDSVNTIAPAKGVVYYASNSASPTVVTNLPVTHGGTGKNSLTANSLLYGNGTNNVAELASAKGVVYYAAAGSAPTVVANLPVTHGGTGKNTINKNSLVYGDNTGALKEITPTGNTPKGVVYYSAANTAPSIVSELPVTHGGTGVDTLTSEGLVVAHGSNSFTALTPAKGTVYYYEDENDNLVPGISEDLPVTHGGTGKDSVTPNALLYGNGTDPMTELLSTKGVVYYMSTGSSPAVVTNLPVTHGGTGKDSLTANSILYGNGANNVAELASIKGVVHYASAGAAPTVISELPVSHGGTGRNTLTSNSLLYGNGTGKVSELASAKGVVYYASAGASPTVVTNLPVTHGGTGVNTLTANGLIIAHGANNFTALTPAKGTVYYYKDTDNNIVPGISENLPVTHGGTGKDSLTANSILYGNGTSNVAELASVKGVVHYASAGSAPTVVSELPVSHGGTGVNTLTANGIIIAHGTNKFTALTPTKGAVYYYKDTNNNIVPGISENLPVSHGGTGKNSLTANSLLYGNGTNNVAELASAKGVVYYASAGSAPTVVANLPVTHGGTGKNSLTANSILYGNGANNVAELASTKGVVYYASAGSAPTVVPELPVSHGGTGVNTLTANGLIIAHGANDFTALTPAKGTVYYYEDEDNNLVPGIGENLPVTHGGTGKDTINKNSLVYGDNTGALKEITPTGNTPKGVVYYSATNTAPSIISELPVTHGGTGKNSLTANSILYGNGANNVAELASAKGVVYYAAAGSAPTVVTNLPVTHGGTGKDAINKNSIVYGDNTGALKEITPTGNTPKGVVYYAAANTAPTIVSELPVSHGGSGRNTLTSNAIITGNGTGNVNMITTADGAFYATAANGAAKFGTLPVAQGGTGVKTITADGLVIGNGTSAVTTLTPAKGAVYYTADKKPAIISELPVTHGGTGNNTNTANSVLVGNGTSAVKNIASASGALYATAANGEPVFGTLPIAQGGTGKTTINKNSLVYGDNTGALKEITPTGNTPKGVVYYSAANTAPTIVSELPVTHGGSGANTLTANGFILAHGTSAFTALTPAKGVVYYDNNSNPGITTNLPVSHGGTGKNSLTANSILYGNGANNVAELASTKGVVYYAAAGDAPTVVSELPVSHGGTGRNTLTANYVLAGNGTNAVNMLQTKSGALYATSTNGAAKFGTLPVAQGGTGQTDLDNVTVGQASRSTGTASTSNAYTHVWFSTSDIETARATDDDFTYNASTNTAKIGSVIIGTKAQWTYNSTTQSLDLAFV